jgi:hypothetical protein
MTSTSLTFSYSGRNYMFSGDLDSVLKGRLSCDCMKSMLIREYCDPGFPALKCGNKIVLVSLVQLPPARRAKVG